MTNDLETTTIIGTIKAFRPSASSETGGQSYSMDEDEIKEADASKVAFTRDRKNRIQLYAQRVAAGLSPFSDSPKKRKNEKPKTR